MCPPSPTRTWRLWSQAMTAALREAFFRGPSAWSSGRRRPRASPRALPVSGTAPATLDAGSSCQQAIQRGVSVKSVEGWGRGVLTITLACLQPSPL